jgi:hypothetical protein
MFTRDLLEDVKQKGNEKKTMIQSLNAIHFPVN